MDTNKELETAWKFIENTNVSVFLTGKAGTGKTTFLRKVYTEMPKRKVVVAPTGVAAINAGGVTIHSFFQLSFGIHIPGEKTHNNEGYYQMSKTKKQIMRTLDLLIIDEISMVRSDLLDAIDEVLRKYRDPDKPFGGVQLLMIGDLHQLAPVATENEWNLLRNYYDTQFFFGSRALRKTQYITLELTKIYRQSDKHFIDLLAQVRSGMLDAPTVKELNKRYIPDFQPSGREEYIRLTTHNYMANQYNQQELNKLESQSHFFTCKVEKVFPENSYPAEATLELKTGAQVMFIKNGNGYYNGKIGKVVGFSEDGILVQGRDDSRPLCVGMAEWENTEYEIDPVTKEIKEKIIGLFKQYPLRLAWSITVHKSQGLTFDHAVLDINKSFAHGQVYVALSRCRSLEGLVLTQPIQIKSLQNDPTVTSYIDNEVSASLKAASRYDELKSQYIRSLLDDLFDFRQLISCVNDFTRVFNEFLFRNYSELCNSWNSASSNIQTSVLDVASKFKSQYDRLLVSSNYNIETPLLQERIQKAADYFSTKLYEEFSTLLNSSKNLQISNKQTRKRYENSLERLMMEMRLKYLTLSYHSKVAFSIHSYLREKAYALMPEEERAKRKRQQKIKMVVSKKPASKKGDSARISLDMLKSGMDYTSIAAERNLAPSTIFGHLNTFVKSGDIQLSDIIIQSHKTFVANLISTHDRPEYMSDFLKLLPANICKSEYWAILHELGYSPSESKEQND